MISINEVTIISIDKDDEESWAIEGEILFEGDLTIPFSTAYLIEDDDFEDFEIEMVPDDYDEKLLKSMILKVANEFDDEDFY